MWVLATCAIALWWVANAVTSIASKSVVSVEERGTQNHGWEFAFENLRWLELTFLQHLVGTIVVVVWLKAVLRESLHPHGASKKSIVAATVCNAAGNLATNAAYVTISSSATQVIKTFEPLFTLVFSLILKKNHVVILNSYSKLVSILIMIAGACAFVLKDTSCSILELAAAVASNVAIPIRNIFLKRMLVNNSWQNSLQSYAVVSFYGMLLLAPAMVSKLALTKTVFMIRLNGSMISAVFHSVYNLASITVLQDVSPITHAILNLSKRVLVIIANILYFHSQLSASMAGSLFIFFFGLALYQTTIKTFKQGCTWCLKTALIAVLTVVCILIASENATNKHYRFQYLKSYNIALHAPSAQEVNKDPIRADLKFLTQHSLQRRISTAWVFDRAISEDVLANIQYLSAHNPTMPVHVYCGTSQCLKAVTDLNISDITAEFLVINKIVKDTPIEQWLARHAINKVLAGPRFEDHLQDAVHLGILWSQGGIFVGPTKRVVGALPLDPFQEAWVYSKQGRVTARLLDVSYFPKHHPFIGELAEHFASEYPKVGQENINFIFDFHRIVWTTYNNISDTSKPASQPLEIKTLSPSKSTGKSHFGTLSYGNRMTTINMSNLGDEIQGFPGLQFVPFIDSFVDRDELKLSAGNQNITTFFNAWWGVTKASWPPPSNINPVMLSMHIHDTVKPQWAAEKDYLESKAPIGCRDLDTLEFLRGLHIDAYFSGCLTLLIKSPFINTKRTNNVFLVDIQSEFMDMLPLEVREKGLTVSHNVEIVKGESDHFTSFMAAYQLMEKYATAKLVITQRIHCALPCVAMGTPVIFINSQSMLGGGGGLQNMGSTHTMGLTPMFHTVDLYKTTMDEAKQWLHDFPWNDPPPNPEVAMVMRLKATAWNVIRQDQSLYDAARKFDLVPVSPPAPLSSTQLLFHLIFTTSDNFNWRHLRSIESIFYHHPFARVVIHSNTLPQTEFAALTEAGYSIELQPYSLEELLKDSPAENFTNNFQGFDKGKYWYVHEADLLRLVILYIWGGVYIDTDVIIVQPLNSLGKNIIGWEKPHNNSANGAFMIFEKGNSFLKACLKEFADHYNGSLWGYNCPLLLTRVWRTSFRESNEVQIVEYSVFYMFPYKVKAECFFNDSKESFLQYMKTLREKAYAVHLNSKLTADVGVNNKLKEGTFCKYLLNFYCVLCNKQY